MKLHLLEGTRAEGYTTFGCMWRQGECTEETEYLCRRQAAGGRRHGAGGDPAAVQNHGLLAGRLGKVDGPHGGRGAAGAGHRSAAGKAGERRRHGMRGDG
jgi:hypothetical protein